MKRLVFLDLDGTIICSDQTVPESTREACRKAIENGHTLLMCTGRCKTEIYPWLWDIGFEGLIGANGAHGFLDGKDLFDHRLDRDMIAEVDAYFAQHGIQRIWQSPVAMYPSPGYLESFFAGSPEIADQWSGYLKQIAPYVSVEEPQSASKCMFTIPSDSDLEVADVADHFKEDLDIIPASVDTEVEKAGELMRRGYTKGTGLVEVSEVLGFPIENTIAIGDNYNDLDMVKNAGIGVAMGNAKQAVKDVADWTTSSIDEGGVAKAFQKLGLVD